MVEINRGHVCAALELWITVAAIVFFTTEALGQNRIYFGAIGLIVGIALMAFGFRYLTQEML
jgi:hypothetical protein